MTKIECSECGKELYEDNDENNPIEDEKIAMYHPRYSHHGNPVAVCQKHWLQYEALDEQDANDKE